MGKAWDINENTADEDEQQDLSESGAIPAHEADDGKTDDRGLNRADSESDGTSKQ